jgi:branched-chain amino acid aminotransferase
MLDDSGFVSELNDTNLFMVKDDMLYTPLADACLPGITRGRVIEVARELNIEVTVKNLSLTEFYAADEVFATGTMGELTPVFEIDGRKIKRNAAGTIRLELSRAFKNSIADLCEKL